MSPGNSLLPRGFKPLANSLNEDSIGEQSSSQSQQQSAIPGGPTNLRFTKVPLDGNLYLSISQLEAQKKTIQHQIQHLQQQLEFLQNSTSNRSSNMEAASEATSDSKGKAILTSSSPSISDCDQHGKTEEMDTKTAAL